MRYIVELEAATFSFASSHCRESLYGRKIVGARIEDQALSLAFDKGEVLRLSGAGRNFPAVYFNCDDSVAKIVGGRLRGIELRPDRSRSMGTFAPSAEAFLEISTYDCFITVRAQCESLVSLERIVLHIARHQLH
jgi:hypothetical protein